MIDLKTANRVCQISGDMPVTIPVPKKDKRKLIATYHYRISKVKYTKEIFKYKVHKDFIFDGASIPRFFWRVIGHPFMPDFERAALLHDYLYKYGIGTRKMADILFYEILIYDGVKKFKAWQMYQAVRKFGMWSWDSKRKKARKKNKK